MFEFFKKKVGSASPSSPGLPVHTTLAPPVIPVHLKLCFLEPDKATERPFPKGLKVKVGKGEYEVKDNGYVTFPAQKPGRSAKWEFTLELERSKYVVCEAPGAAAAGYPKLADAPPAGAERYFMLPAEHWGLQNSAWKLNTGANVTFNAPKGLLKHPDETKPIGTADAPAKLVLDPHWQYLRFEFFDRYYGHTNHADKRVSVPELPVEGYADHTKTKSGATTRSNWTYKRDTPQEMCHCLPWIVQTKEKPVGEELIRFSTEPGTFVYSETDAKRLIEKVDDAERLKPSAERLKLYDLPREWKSTGYFTRPKNKLFQDVDKATHQASLDHAGRLVFCLDDVVLVGPDMKPVIVTDKDRLAVFDHRFGQEGGAAGDRINLTRSVGLYKNDSANNKPYFSYVDGQPGKNHITDYADWTRLVVFKGNLYDAFDRRTEAANGHTVVGARAAVRWADAAAATKPPGQIMKTRPQVRKYDFFAVQPCYEQSYSAFGRKYVGPGSPTWSIGKFDQALLRCCGYDGDKEEIVCLEYFRMHYKFYDKVPVVSDVRYEKTDTSIKLAWKTDVPCWRDGGDVNASGDPDMKTVHQIQYNGLTPSTTYDVPLKAVDAGGNTAERKYQIQTLALGAAMASGNAPAPATSTNAPGGLATTAAQDDFVAKNTTNIMARMNGNDTAITNANRPRLLPRTTGKIKGQVVWIMQRAQAEAQAHYSITVTDPKQGRCFMSSSGEGKFTTASAAPEGSFIAESYVAAHETGHGSSLPDEYCERWSGCSHGEISFKGRLPGDPFEDDGRNEPTSAAMTPTVETWSALMDGVVQMRNRYYWHVAEFARTVTGVDLMIGHSMGGQAYNDYWLPPHPDAPACTYAYWPLNDAVDVRSGNAMERTLIFKTKDNTLTISTAPASAGVGSDTATITWATSLPADSLVEYGTAKGNYTSREKLDGAADQHRVVLRGLTAGQAYFYRVQATDGQGRQATGQEGTFTTAGNPTIAFTTDPASSGVKLNAATITCKTDKAADATVEYGLTTAYGSTKVMALAGGSLSANLTGLEAGKEYHYRVKAKSRDDASEKCSGDATFRTLDAALQVVGAPSVPADSITNSTATVHWKTNRDADSMVEYGTRAGGSYSKASDSNSTTEHAVVLSGLQAGRKYFYRCTSKSGKDSTGRTAEANFITLSKEGPDIRNVAGAAAGSTSATISWTTNEGADSLVEYGETAAYGSSTGVLDRGMVAAHSVTLNGLKSGTGYHYRVRSCNRDGGVSLSGDFTFRTGGATAVTISNVRAEQVSSSSATILWTTSAAADSQVNYEGATGGKKSASDSASVTEHKVVLTGLSAGNCTYEVRSGSASMGGNTFTVPAGAGPAITTAPAAAADMGEATITWKTGVDAAGEVEYGTASNYGSTAKPSPDPGATQDHSVQVKGLTPGTLYHYRVRSKAGSDTSVSADATFQTLAAGAPKISDVQASQISATEVRITWTTDVGGDSRVDWGPSTPYANHVGPVAGPTKSHSVNVTVPAGAKTYHFAVTSEAAGGGNTQSPDATFQVADANGPMIHDERAEDIASDQVTIKWTTDVNADGEVEWGPTSSYGQNKKQAGGNSRDHSVQLTGLQPNTTYYCKLKSKTADGPPYCDLLLYATGRDRFTDGILTGGPYKGILTIPVRIKIDLCGEVDAAYRPQLCKVRNAIIVNFNGPNGGFKGFLAEGIASRNTPREWAMTNPGKCLVLFSPAFLVRNANPSGTVEEIGREFGVHMNIWIQTIREAAGGTVHRAAATRVTMTNHGLRPGDVVEITGASAPDWDALNGFWPVAVTDADKFTIPVNSSAFGAAYGGGAKVRTHRRRRIAGNLQARALATVTAAGHGLDSNTQVCIDGDAAGGAWASVGYHRVTILDSDRFLIDKDVSASGAYPGKVMLRAGFGVIPITKATKANPCMLTAAGHGLRTGDRVRIQDAAGLWAGLSGGWEATVFSPDVFSVPFNSNSAGVYPGGASVVSYQKNIPITAFAHTPGTQVEARGHGLNNGDPATLSGGSGTFNAMNGSHPVVRIDDDHYAIAVAHPGAGPGAPGVSEVAGTDLVYDLTSGDPDAQLEADAVALFARNFGFASYADVKPENLRPLVERVIEKVTDVRKR